MNKMIKSGVLAVLFATTLGSALVATSSAETFRQEHPRRAEVLHRDRGEMHELNADKGHLGGHYNQLRREDIAIHRQEQRDARMDGGHITRGEQRHLNHEENRLQRQINRDHN